MTSEEKEKKMKEAKFHHTSIHLIFNNDNKAMHVPAIKDFVVF